MDMFERLNAPSLKELFVRQLEGNILSGRLSVGAQLPTERELARQMQVSRAVVNGGIAELAHKGFLEVRPRQGTYVADYRRRGNMSTLIAIMDYRGGVLGKKEIRAILEVRRALEHMAADLAIDNATEADLARLKELLESIRASQTPQQASAAAFSFQHELAYVGGNFILPLIYYSFKGSVEVLWQRFCRLHGIGQLYDNSSRLHGHLISRDKAAAANWIDQYLGEAIEGNQQIYTE